MADPRLNSMHLGLDLRRQEYRRAREALLGARGWLTLAAERFLGLEAEADEWQSVLPLRPGQVFPATKFLLVDLLADRAFALKTGLNTIGRMPDNDIVFEEPAVSRRHCVILIHLWGGGELHDTASRNGTFVNSQRVCRPVALASGDRIQLCGKRLLFVSEQDCRVEGEYDDHPATVVE